MQGKIKGGIIVDSGITYCYLIELYLAKEFIEEWAASLDYIPTIDEKARRIYEYAINDA